MTDNFKITVVIATYNRSATLEATLRRLMEQKIRPEYFEAIVSDDGSTDDTREIVAKAQKEALFALKYSCHDNHGCGFTQNQGIREARAPIVLLIADDIWLEPDALQKHLDCHEKHPEPEVSVLGRVLQSPLANSSVFLRIWDPFKFRRLADDAELPYYMFWACNVSFKREFMLCYGMFRDHKGRAGYAAHEDAEVGYRLHMHGLRIRYCEEALGYHHHLTTLESEMKRAYARGLNWDEFKQYVDAPELDVRYHVLMAANFLDYVRVFFGPRRQYLMAPDNSLFLSIVQHAVRIILFNRLTVNLIWLPLLAQAERRRFFEFFAHREIYRGVIFYQFIRGCHDGQKIYGKL